MQFIKYFILLVILAVQYSFQSNSGYRVYVHRNNQANGNEQLEDYNQETGTNDNNGEREEILYKRDNSPLNSVGKLIQKAEDLQKLTDSTFKMTSRN